MYIFLCFPPHTQKWGWVYIYELSWGLRKKKRKKGQIRGKGENRREKEKRGRERVKKEGQRGKEKGEEFSCILGGTFEVDHFRDTKTLPETTILQSLPGLKKPCKIYLFFSRGFGLRTNLHP